MALKNQNIYLIVLNCLYVFVLVLLILSDNLLDWFSYTKVSACYWKGNASEVYSSPCYTHKSYADTKCEDCECCYGDDLISMTDLHGSSVCILANFVIVILWLIFNFLLNVIKIKFKLKIMKFYWKVYVATYIFLGIISCFLTGSSHPSDLNMKVGYDLRLSAIILYYVVGLVHLIYCCKKIIKSKSKNTSDNPYSKELLDSEKADISLEEKKNYTNDVRIQ